MEELLKEISVGSLLQGLIFSFVLGLTAIFAGLILRFRLRTGDLRRVEKLTKAKAVPIAQAQPPSAKIEGTVAPSHAGTVRSPLTGRECVLYTITVTEFFQSRGQYHSNDVHQERDAREFYLQDASGHARIVAGEPVLMAKGDTLAQSGVPTSAVQAAFAGWAHHRGLTLTERMSVTEKRIEVGQHVVVHGQVNRQGPEPVLAGSANDPLTIAAAREGQVGVRSWMAHLDRVAIGIGCLMMLAPVLVVAAFVAYVFVMR
jgi:hypothetical protein